jgi:D-serine deaminase-like pyridoxal phosphate-dependent protein
MAKEWYLINNIEDLDSPALVVYRSRVEKNIQTLSDSIDDVKRLRPHVKTHKSSQVCSMMLAAGITKFKCATIAEAEMLAVAGTSDVLLAYQPVGPKASRLASLVQQFPGTKFSCLIDNPSAAENIATIFASLNLCLPVYIDLNVGMNRTGISPVDGLKLYEACNELTGIAISGLHAYDGHIRNPDLGERKIACDTALAPVLKLQAEIQSGYGKLLPIVAGGTPTYAVHCQRPDVECSPGTFIYWDHGYETILKEQNYLHAAVVVTRIISKPMPDIICIDLGHKSIAAENPIHHRIHFLNATNLQPVGHSEEHMSLKVLGENNYQVGDVLYGIPYHVCPTVALYDRVAVAVENTIITYWSTLARNRSINV